jgi:hypothetical protein
MQKILKYNQDGISLVNSSDEAETLYRWAESIPQSITRDIFRKKTGFFLNGISAQIGGKLILAYNAEGAAHVFKMWLSQILVRFGLALRFEKVQI